MNKRFGFIALSTVLVLSAIFLSLGIAVASRAIAGATMATALQTQTEAKHLSDACAEYALMELSRTLNYSGNDSILIEGQTCLIRHIEGSGNYNRTVEAVGTVSDYTYRTKVLVEEVSPIMTIESWEGVKSF